MYTLYSAQILHTPIDFPRGSGGQAAVKYSTLRGPRSTVRMVLLKTSAIIGYYRI